jgi:CDP-6-deoxy-D-xylo-4-hexulose-3-dehydrase
MMGAVGIEQLKKLDGFVKVRRENAERWKEYCASRGWWHQKEPNHAQSSWFAFAIVDDNIEEIKKELEESGVEYRPLVAGNFTRSASIKYYNHEVHGNLVNADRIHEKGIYIGNTHEVTHFDH